MLKFKTSCAVLANLSSNLLNEVGLSFFRYFEVGLRVCDIVVIKFTFAISSPDEFLYFGRIVHGGGRAKSAILDCLVIVVHQKRISSSVRRDIMLSKWTGSLT